MWAACACRRARSCRRAACASNLAITSYGWLERPAQPTFRPPELTCLHGDDCVRLHTPEERGELDTRWEWHACCHTTWGVPTGQMGAEWPRAGRRLPAQFGRQSGGPSGRNGCLGWHAQSGAMGVAGSRPQPPRPLPPGSGRATLDSRGTER